jgi:hypothetical protein
MGDDGQRAMSMIRGAAMNDLAARPPEFGTGLRARLERADRARERAPVPSSRDLVDLLVEEPVERSTPELVLVAGDLTRPRAAGPVAV